MGFIGTALRTLVSVIITVISFMAPWLVGDYTAPNAPINSEECLLNFAAISDMHVDTEEYDKEDSVYTDITHHAFLPDFENAEEKLDALVLAGDITEHGYVAQWDKTEKLLVSYDLADEIILAAGNHDLWTNGDQGRTAKGLFMQYNKRITGRFETDVYYSTEVNGYTFIVLCSEEDSEYAYFSDKQIKWLKAELKEAAKKDLPIFVICHWPLSQTHGLPVTWGDEEYNDMTGGMGEQSARIEKILKKYDNVFFISGHIHSGFSNADMEAESGYQSIESDGSFHSVNLPRVNAVSKRGYFMIGTGYNVEVYENEVVFRARNYMTGTWCPEFDYTIELV